MAGKVKTLLLAEGVTVTPSVIQTSDVINGGQAGPLVIGTTDAQSVTINTDSVNRMSISSTGAVVFNEGGVSTADFRVETDNEATAFQLDASEDRIDLRANVVFNESGNASYDVRMEGDTNANLFFLDASEDTVNIGCDGTGGVKCTISGSLTASGVEQIMRITGNDDNANAGGLNISCAHAAGASTRYVYLDSVDEQAQSAPIVFQANGGGNFGIGISPVSTARVHIKGESATSSDSALLVQNSSATTFQVVNDGAIKMPLIPSSGGTHELRWNSGTYAVTYTTVSSSERFKEKIRTLEIDSSKIYDLIIKSWDYKKSHQPDENARLNRLGPIAEDVEKIYPSCVERDGSGKVIKNRDNEIMYLMLEEMKKLKSRIEVLEAKLNI